MLLTKYIILNASKLVNINPYIEPFKTSDLKLNSNEYGSFSDYCSLTDSKLGKYNKNTIIKVHETNKDGKPFKYLLL